MSKLSEKKVIELLKTGNFSIIYHDNGCGSLYKGHHTTDSVSEKEIEPVYEFEPDGYYTSDVDFLVKALGGKLDSY